MSRKDPKLTLHELTDIDVADSYEETRNPDHLKHVFAGYRDFVLNGHQAFNPFKKDEVAHRSWKVGADLAKTDIGPIIAPLFTR